jgi:biotin carboxyl carrier protein
MSAFPARSLVLGTGLVAALGTVLLLSGCERAAPASGEVKPVDVVVTTPITADVTDFQDFTGRLDAIYTIDMRPRVSGYIDLAPFKEGDMVKKGDLLFQIDPRPYEKDLNQAEANLRLAQADRNLQEKNVERARRLYNSNAIAREEYDQIAATWEKSAANVKALEATRDRTRLYLDFTRVIAPCNGRISRRNVDPGNLVNADTTLLTTIVTEELPETDQQTAGSNKARRLYAYFDVDERTTSTYPGPAPTATRPRLPASALRSSCGWPTRRNSPATAASCVPAKGRPVPAARRGEIHSRRRNQFYRQPDHRHDRHRSHARRLPQRHRLTQARPVRAHPPADRQPPRGGPRSRRGTNE